MAAASRALAATVGGRVHELRGSLVGGKSLSQVERVPGSQAAKDFEIVPAFCEALKDEVYRIRHQVYCEELAFEPQRPDRREQDEYDAHSLHLLIRSLRYGEFIGCTRLVRTRPDDPHYPLPFEKTCAATLDRAIVDPAKLPREHIGEVSRLAVLARFRKRSGEERRAANLVGSLDALSHPRFPHIFVELYLGIIELARLNRIDTLFVLSEERLARHLRILGFQVQTIGGPIEHRGQRVPSMISNFYSQVRPLQRTTAAEAARRH